MRSISIMLLVALATHSFAQTNTTFTYQGKLDYQGSPYTGSADYHFTLYDAATNGNLVGATVQKTGIDVADGLFTVGIDFGATPHGPGRYLQIAVRVPAWDGQGAPPPFFVFPDRQPVTPAPFALQTRGLQVNEAGDRVGIGYSPQAQTTLVVGGGVAALSGSPAGGGVNSGYSFLSSPNTGLYMAFSNAVSICINAVESFRFTATSIRFPDGSTQSTAAPRIVHGGVLTTGTAFPGSVGFTSQRISTGRYRITFSPAYASTPTVVASSANTLGNTIVASVISVTNTTCDIDTRFAPGNTYIDSVFRFVAVGN